MRVKKMMTRLWFGTLRRRLATETAIAACVLLQAVVPKCEGADDYNVIQSFEFQCADERLIVVPTTFSGRTVWGALDTGTEISVYDISLRHLLGELQGTTPIETPRGTEAAELFLAPRVSAGKLRLHHDSGMILCRDMGTIRSATKQIIRIIVGMDALRRTVLRIDPTTGTLSFLRGPQVKHSKAIPFRDEGAPVVSMQVLATRRDDFTIDTGSIGQEGNVLSSVLFHRLLREGQLIEQESAFSTSISGTRRVRQGRLRHPISFGGVCDSGVGFAEGRENVLGLGFLLRHTVTFDFRQHMLYVEPIQDAKTGQTRKRVRGHGKR